VVGDRGTRVVANKASAIAFTVDDSIFSAGDTLGVHNINTGVLTLTAGAGVTLNGADVLTVAQYQSGTIFFTSASSAIFFPTAKTVSAGGLTLITTQTIGSAVSSVTVTGCFSATYENYRIILSGGVASTNVNLRLTLGATSTGYYGFAVYGVHNSNTVNGTAENNTAFWDYCFLGSANALTGVVDLLQPQTAKHSQVIAFTQVAASSASGISVFKSGFLDDATQYTAFTLTCNTGNITGGTIKVYGYSNS